MKNKKLRMLVEGAMMVALAVVLSYVRVFKLPWGGSVTLLSMLPIVIYSIRWGVKAGFATAFVFSLAQFAQGCADGLFGWGLTPVMLIACILLDYVLAFTVLGSAGFFRKKGMPGWIGGTVLAIVLRFLCHFGSGVVIWHSFGELWNGFSTDNTYLYSLLYNGAYMLPELVFTLIATVILFGVPVIRKFLTSTDATA